MKTPRALKSFAACAALACGFAAQAGAVTTADYVQDGLVGQWDGIENAGRGVHESEPTAWKNLCGGDIDFPLAGCTIGPDSVTVPSGVSPKVEKSLFGSTTVAEGCAQPMTIELVWQVDGTLANDYYLLTLDETYLYRQNQTEMIIPFGYRTNNKVWDKVPYSNAELTKLGFVSFVNPATASGEETFTLNGERRKRTGTASTSTLSSWRGRTHLVQSTGSFSFMVIYKAIRVYDRVLSAAEQERNRILDLVRFSDDPTQVVLPDGWRYDAEKGIQYAVDIEIIGDGRVSLAGEALSESGRVWICLDDAQVSLAASADTGWAFNRWNVDLGTVVARGQAETEMLTIGAPTRLRCEFVAAGQEGAISTLDYVTRGLVGQWDGIENVARGTHEETPTAWNNLCGGDMNVPLSGCVIGTDSVTVPSGVTPVVNGTLFNATTLAEYCSQPYTIELVWQVDGTYRKSPDYQLFRLNQSYLYKQNDSEAIIAFAYGSAGKNWGKFKYSDAEWAKMSCISFGNPATGAGNATFTYEGEDRAYLGSAYTQTLGSGDMQNNLKLVTTTDTRNFSIVYKAIRVYRNVLTREEKMTNYALDQMRFFGKSPEEVNLPEGWRYDAADGLQFRVAITANEYGAFSVDGGAACGAWTNWCAAGREVSFALKARPNAGATFLGWTADGGTLSDAKAAETVLSNVTGPTIISCTFVGGDPNVTTLSAAHYLDHGLVAQWDAIENQGYGFHSDAPQTWVELRHGELNFPLASCVVGADTLTVPPGVTPTLNASVFGPQARIDQPCTVELVWNMSNAKCWLSNYFLFTLDETYFYFPSDHANGMMVASTFRTTSGLNKSWGCFGCSTAEATAPTTVSFVNAATGWGCSYLRLDGGPLRGHPQSSSETTLSALQLRTALVQTDRAREFDVVYRSIRVYDRALSPDEQLVNRALDEIRFFGKSPDEVTLPPDYRFDGETNLEYRVRVAANGAGTVAVNGAAEVWLKRGQRNVELSLTATDGANAFAGWRTSDGTLSAAEAKTSQLQLDAVLAPVTVTADFFGETAAPVPLARNYVKDGLVLCLDGRENVGPGRHDMTADVWVNLAKGQPIESVPLDGCRVRSDSVEVLSGATGAVNVSPFGTLDATAAAGQPMTVEVVWSLDRWMDCGAADGDMSFLLTLDETYFYSTRGSALTTVSARSVEKGVVKKSWPTFSCGVSDLLVPNCLSFVNPATGVADVGLSVNGGEMLPSVLNLQTQSGGGVTNRRRFALAGTAARECVPTYRAIRVYSRVLTDDERKINYAVDQVRFFGVAPSEAAKLLPKGYRFDGDGNVVHGGTMILIR